MACPRQKSRARKGRGIFFPACVGFFRASNRNGGEWILGRAARKGRRPLLRPAPKSRAGPCAGSRFFSFLLLFFSLLYFSLLYFVEFSVYKKGESADRNRVCVDRFTHLYIKFGKYFHSLSRGMMLHLRKNACAGRGKSRAEAGFPQLFTAFQQGFPHAEIRAKKHRTCPAKKRPFQGLFLQTFRKSAARGFYGRFSAVQREKKIKAAQNKAARCRQTATAPRWWETGSQSKRPRRGSTPPR